jgi:RHS repeat-associated protein
VRRVFVSVLIAAFVVVGLPIVAPELAAPSALADEGAYDSPLAALTKTGPNSLGQQQNADGLVPSISADGRWLAFISSHDDLPNPVTPIDCSPSSCSRQVWLKDLASETGDVFLVSEISPGDSTSDPTDGSTDGPVISADGKKVAFLADSNDLSSADNNNDQDIFVADMSGVVEGTATTADSVQLVSADESGAPGSEDSGGVDDVEISISADGNWVAFSTLSQLLPCAEPPAGRCDANADGTDIYLKEVAGGESGALHLVTYDEGETNPTMGGGALRRFAVSRSADKVMFYAEGGFWLFDRETTGANRVRALPGSELDVFGGSHYAMSPDGTMVLPIQDAGGGLARVRVSDDFESAESWERTYLKCEGDTTGEPVRATFLHPSAFGLRIAFVTSHNPDVCADGKPTGSSQYDGNDNVYVLDGSGITWGLADAASAWPNNDSYDPSLSVGGTYLVFTSSSTNILTGEGGANDVFGKGADFLPPGAGDGPWEAFAGDPVNVVTGAFAHEIVDLETGSVNRLGFERVFNSGRDADRGFGPGWSHSFSMGLAPGDPGDLGDTDVLLRDEAGRQFLFTNTAANTWARPKGLLADLTLSSGIYVLSWVNGTTWTFDSSFRIAEIEDADGQLRTVTYPSNQIEVEDSATGDTLALADTTSTPDGRFDQASLSSGSETRVVAFKYHSTSGFLESSSEPGDGAGGGIAEFYETDPTDGLVTAIRNGTVDADRNGVKEATGELVIANTYNLWRRVVAQISVTGETITFSYDNSLGGTPPLWETVVTYDPGGGDEETVRYRYNAASEVVQIIDSTPQEGEVGRTFSTTAGSVGQPETVWDRRGAPTQNVYNEGRLIERKHPSATTTNTYGASETFDYVGSDDPRLEVHVNQAGEKSSYHYSGANQVPSEIRQCTGGTSSQVCATGSGTITTSITLESDADLVGLVASVSDPDGVTTSYEYDDPNDTAGADLDCGARRLCEVTVQNGAGTGDDAVTEYTYDDLSGQVASVTEYNAAGSADDAITTLAYDAAGRVTQEIGPLASADYAADSDYDVHFPTEYGYDAAGRLWWLSDDANSDTAGPDGASVVYAYLPDGSVSTETRLLGSLTPGGSSTTVTTKYRYDTAGRLTSVTDADDGDGDIGGAETNAPNEATTFHTYTDLGRLESTTDPVGVEMWFCYDTDGNLTHTVADPSGPTCASLGNPNGSAQHTRTTYDLLGRVTSEVNAEGETTSYGYDALGRVTSLTEADGSGVERTTTNSYDGFGRLVASSGERGDFWNGIVEKRVYTAAGRLDAVCAPPPDIFESSQGFSWDSTCNGTGERLTDYVWTSGRLTRVTEPTGDKTDYTHDPAGRVLTETAGATTADAATTTYGYDVAGQRTSVTRPAGNGNDVTAETTYGPRGVLSETDFYDGGTPATRDFAYNQAGWLVSATDANDVTVDYEYDVRGNRRFRNSDLDGSTPVTEEWQYDRADRLTKAVDPLAEETTYAYGASAGTGYGRLTSVADPSGRTRTIGYDYAGRITSESWAASGLTTISIAAVFDDLGRATSRTRTGTAETGAVSYTYNPDDTISQVNGPRTGGSFDADRIQYEWSITGTPAAMTYPNGAVLEYEHDDRDRIVNTFLDSGGTPLPIGEYTYDGRGNMETESLDNGDVAIRTYAYQDDASQPTYYEQDFVTISGEDLATKIAYRDDGRIGSVCEFDDPASTSETTNCDNEGDDVLSEYGYDPAGQLEAVTIDDILTTDVTYNQSGMRDTYTAYDPDTGDELTQDSYTFDEAGQLQQVDKAEWTGSAWDDPSVVAEFDYDAAGRRELVTDTAGTPTTLWDYTWNAKGELVAGNDGTSTETYAYNAAGERTSGATTSTTSSMVWDPATGPISRVITTHDSATNWTFNAGYGLRGLYISLFGWWGSLDHLGSNLGPAGYPLDATYDEWGVRDPAIGGTGYRGESQTKDHIHLRNRDYDPTTGTFLTPDPLTQGPGSPELGTGIPFEGGTPVEANTYHYVGNDPLNWTDPLGLCRMTDAVVNSYIGGGGGLAGESLGEQTDCNLSRSGPCGTFVANLAGGIGEGILPQSFEMTIYPLPAPALPGTPDWMTYDSPNPANFRRATELLNIDDQYCRGGPAFTIGNILGTLALYTIIARAASGVGGGGTPGAPIPPGYHHTTPQAVDSIVANGLRPGSYVTPTPGLSPLQAHIELALNPAGGARNSVLQIDLAGLRAAGYRIPTTTRVTGAHGMPGGGYEIHFPYEIPPEFIKVMR